MQEQGLHLYNSDGVHLHGANISGVLSTENISTTGDLSINGDLYINGTGPIIYEEGISQTIGYNGAWVGTIDYHFDIIGNTVHGTIGGQYDLCTVQNRLISTDLIADVRLRPSTEVEVAIVVYVDGQRKPGYLQIHTSGGTEIYVCDPPNNDQFLVGQVVGTERVAFTYRRVEAP